MNAWKLGLFVRRHWSRSRRLGCFRSGNHQPATGLGVVRGRWFAIFGAILGGVADVVQAIQKKT